MIVERINDLEDVEMKIGEEMMDFEGEMLSRGVNVRKFVCGKCVEVRVFQGFCV